MNPHKRRSSISGLVITSREGDQVIINNGEIIIEVVSIKGKQVRVCFQAHKDISIKRQDYVKIEREQGLERQPRNQIP